ncbi:hypothetical protein P3S67_014662 [Capsicum chacoense]
MEGIITIEVDCHGHWVEKSNRYVWRWKEGEMPETIAMTIQSDVSYDDFVNLIISFCGLNYQLEEFAISYMNSSFENQRVLPFKITDQDKNELSNTFVFCFKCTNSNSKWWLRVVKYASSDRFVIHKHEKHHTCGSEHISGQNPHATTKVLEHLGENIRNNYHNERVVTLFYRAAKAYSREEFLGHFNQIVDVNFKVAEFFARVDFERLSRAFCLANS